MKKTKKIEFDTDKLDKAALAILSLTLHDGYRVWKGLDWQITDRLYEKGLIHDPRNKNKSIILTEEGLTLARSAMIEFFAKEQ